MTHSDNTARALYARYTYCCEHATPAITPKAFSSFPNKASLIQLINEMENGPAPQPEPVAVVHITKRLTKVERARLRRASRGTVAGVLERKLWRLADLPVEVATKAGFAPAA